MYPVPCTDCGAEVGEPCVRGCPNLDDYLDTMDLDFDDAYFFFDVEAE